MHKLSAKCGSQHDGKASTYLIVYLSKKRANDRPYGICYIDGRIVGSIPYLFIYSFICSLVTVGL